MATLYRQSPQSAYELCAPSNLDKVQMSRTVARLVGKGWLRKAHDPRDGRRQLLHLTDKGHDLFAEIVTKALAFEADIHTALSVEEHASLNRILDKLNARVEKLLK